MPTSQRIQFQRQEALAVRKILDLGVRMGDPVVTQPNACTNCVWHVVNTETRDQDGGLASSILGWLEDGYLGDPASCVLHPVEREDGR